MEHPALFPFLRSGLLFSVFLNIQILLSIGFFMYNFFLSLLISVKISGYGICLFTGLPCIPYGSRHTACDFPHIGV